MSDPSQMSASENRGMMMQWVVRARRDGRGLELASEEPGIDPVPFDPSPAGDADIGTWTDVHLHGLSRVKLSPDVPKHLRPAEIWKSVSVRRQAGMIVELQRIPGLQVSGTTVSGV